MQELNTSYKSMLIIIITNIISNVALISISLLKIIGIIKLTWLQVLTPYLLTFFICILIALYAEYFIKKS